MQEMLFFTDGSLKAVCKSNSMEAAGKAVEASQILGAAIIAETPGSALVVKETAEYEVEASYEQEQLNR